MILRFKSSLVFRLLYLTFQTYRELGLGCSGEKTASAIGRTVQSIALLAAISIQNSNEIKLDK